MIHYPSYKPNPLRSSPYDPAIVPFTQRPARLPTLPFLPRAQTRTPAAPGRISVRSESNWGSNFTSNHITILFIVILFFIWADNGASINPRYARASLLRQNRGGLNALCGVGKRGEGKARNALGSEVTTALLVLFPNVLYTGLLLSIDNLVTHKIKTKINASVVYSNSDRSGLPGISSFRFF